MNLANACPVMLLTLVVTLAQSAVSESPYSQRFTTWEPYASDPSFGDHSFTSIRRNILGNRTQSYSLERRHTDANGRLTRSRFNRFAGQAGVALLNTHGYQEETGENEFLGPVVFRSTNRDLAYEFAYDSAGELNPYFNVELLAQKGEYVVYVEYEWFAENWRAIFNTWRTLVVAGVCESSTHLEKFGGRAQVGFNKCISTDRAGSQLNKLFSRMNGMKPLGSQQGTKRSIGEAYSLGGWGLNDIQGGLVIGGEANTNLCPSVAHPAVFGSSAAESDNVYPLGADAPLPSSGSVITGHVRFDSVMDRSVPADAVLSYNIMQGMVTIENVRWNGSSQIDFDYRVDDYGYGYGGVQFEVEMIVSAGQAQSFGGGMHKLDGGDIGDDRSGTAVFGVAPNGSGTGQDDFIWVFRR